MLNIPVAGECPFNPGISSKLPDDSSRMLFTGGLGVFNNNGCIWFTSFLAFLAHRMMVVVDYGAKESPISQFPWMGHCGGANYGRT
jgi:hypothetical protein